MKKAIPKLFSNVFSNEEFLDSMTTLDYSSLQFIIDCVQSHYRFKKIEVISKLTSFSNIEKLHLIYCLNHKDCDTLIENIKRFTLLYLFHDLQGLNNKREELEQFKEELSDLLDKFSKISKYEFEGSFLHKICRAMNGRHIDLFESHPANDLLYHRSIISSYYDDKNTSDIKVIIDKDKKQILHLHKTILASASPLFEKMFSDEFMFAKEENIINLYEFNTGDKLTVEQVENLLQILMKSCYGIWKSSNDEKPETINTTNLLLPMIDMGNLFQMDHIIRISIGKLSTQLDLENFQEVCKWALHYGDETYFQNNLSHDSPMQEVFHILSQFAEMNRVALSEKYGNQLQELDFIPYIRSKLETRGRRSPTSKCFIQ